MIISKTAEVIPLMDLTEFFNKATVGAEFEASAYEPAQIIESDKPEIVFSGKSNVGKSSLINRLLNRKKLARVSSAPGKTASVNFYDCTTFRLVDLPGYGYAKVSKQEKQQWSLLVEGFFGSRRNIALVAQLVDSRHSPSDGDLQMIDYLLQKNLPFAVVLTKVDKLKNTELAKRQAEIKNELGNCGAELIFTSAQTALGFDKLKTSIYNSLYSNT